MKHWQTLLTYCEYKGICSICLLNLRPHTSPRPTGVAVTGEVLSYLFDGIGNGCTITKATYWPTVPILNDVLCLWSNYENEWLLRKSEMVGENLPHCRVVHHKSHVTWPGRRGKKPATTAWAMARPDSSSYVSGNRNGRAKSLSTNCTHSNNKHVTFSLRSATGAVHNNKQTHHHVTWNESSIPTWPHDAASHWLLFAAVLRIKGYVVSHIAQWFCATHQ